MQTKPSLLLEIWDRTTLEAQEYFQHHKGMEPTN